MTTVATAVTFDVPIGVSDEVVPSEVPVERTVSMLAIPSNRDGDTDARGGIGWFRWMWHHVDRDARPLTLRDPYRVHGMAGREFLLAECGMAACPDVDRPAVAVSDCPVCWPGPDGHLFVWEYREGRPYPRYIRSACQLFDEETRDSNTGRRRPCAGALAGPRVDV